MPTPVSSAPAIEWPISTGAFRPSVWITVQTSFESDGSS